MNVNELFDNIIPTQFEKFSSAFCIGVSCSILLSDQQNQAWTLEMDVNPPLCRAGVSDSSDCQISISTPDLMSIVSDPQAIMAMFYEGRVKVEGDTDKARMLPSFFDRLKLNLGGKTHNTLEALIAPHSAESFIRDHWHQATPLIVEGDPARWQFLDEVFPFKSVSELLHNWAGTVDVMSNTKDGMRTVGMLADQAEKLWQEDVFTLMFHNVHSQFPALATIMDELRKTLGIPRNLISKPTAYASPEGHGLSWHYDVTANFMMQIAGEKTWYIAPNDVVDTPTVPHTLGKPVSADCADQLHAPMPTEGFANPQVVHMKPGSLMYIPPGYWHKTEAKGESFALSCSLNRPSWAQLVGDCVQRLLSRQSQWRQLAYGAGAENPELNSQAAEHLGLMLGQLSDDLGKLTAQGVFESIPSNSNVFSPTANSVDLTRDWAKALSGLPTNG